LGPDSIAYCEVGPLEDLGVFGTSEDVDIPTRNSVNHLQRTILPRSVALSYDRSEITLEYETDDSLDRIEPAPPPVVGSYELFIPETTLPY
jgi:hypothetical protein